jgi:predicted Rossmann-fold nucleotide-binding protein
MRDTLIYAEFVRGGGAACGDYLTAMSRALHDNGITQALADEMASAKIVAIMGGHIGARGDDVYADTARIAASLAAAGFTIASGGGPGIMEAAHLGAAFAGDSGLEDALKELGAPAVPKAIPANAAHLIAADGSIDTAIAEALGTYLAPAVRVLRALGHGGGLGIPTWLYGHEPTTPLAANIAKYFQNSIREDGLLAIATSGIIYMKGGAGTLQEVFQDAAQNYYKTFPTGPGKTGEFSPMVFYGDFWTDPKQVPIRPVLDALFGTPAQPPARNIGNDYADWVRFLTDPKEVLAHLQSFNGQPTHALALLGSSARRPPGAP